MLCALCFAASLLPECIKQRVSARNGERMRDASMRSWNAPRSGFDCADHDKRGIIAPATYISRRRTIMLPKPITVYFE